MRGVAHDPVFRAKLMALHEQGIPLTILSAEFGVAREVLGRWWRRYQAVTSPGSSPRAVVPAAPPLA
jgi:transposase-like protein